MYLLAMLRSQLLPKRKTYVYLPNPWVREKYSLHAQQAGN